MKFKQFLIERSNIDFAAGVLPFALSTGKFLIGKRSENTTNGGVWNLFGGTPNQGENSPQVVATREFKEETGYDKEIFLKLINVSKKDNFSYFTYLGLIKEEFEPKLNYEHSCYCWLNWQELKNHHGKHIGLRQTIADKFRIILSMTGIQD